MKPIFALLTATGMRRSELLGCKWKYVDGARILLPRRKNDEPKEVHLNSFALRVLASIAPEDRTRCLALPRCDPGSREHGLPPRLRAAQNL